MSTEPTRRCSNCLKANHDDGFPTLGYPNVCWVCFWEQHQIEAHPIPRSERRQIRKRARQIVEQRLSKDVRSMRDAFDQLKEPTA